MENTTLTRIKPKTLTEVGIRTWRCTTIWKTHILQRQTLWLLTPQCSLTDINLNCNIENHFSKKSVIMMPFTSQKTVNTASTSWFYLKYFEIWWWGFCDLLGFIFRLKMVHQSLDRHTTQFFQENCHSQLHSKSYLYSDVLA